MSISISSPDQSSQQHPSVVFDGGLFHMAYQANDPSNRVLYTNSTDGQIFAPLTETGQFCNGPPAIAFANGRVVIVFVSNDPTNRILIMNADPFGPFGSPVFSEPSQLGTESAQAVTALGVGNTVFVYFKSNDPSNRLLVQTFVP